jgi:hypothetical protein
MAQQVDAADGVQMRLISNGAALQNRPGRL